MPRRSKKKKKKKAFRAVASVKALARERIGAVPPAQVVPGRKTKNSPRTQKHKPTLGRLLEGSE